MGIYLLQGQGCMQLAPVRALEFDSILDNDLPTRDSSQDHQEQGLLNGHLGRTRRRN